MGDLVNLNHARKAAAKAARQAEASANRVKHGRTKQQTRADREAEARRMAMLDGARKAEPEPGR
jgi:fructose-1,6-bisphosphatase/inositol monophosphatase family enzyme